MSFYLDERAGFSDTYRSIECVEEVPERSAAEVLMSDAKDSIFGRDKPLTSGAFFESLRKAGINPHALKGGKPCDVLADVPPSLCTQTAYIHDKHAVIAASEMKKLQKKFSVKIVDAPQRPGVDANKTSDPVCAHT